MAKAFEWTIARVCVAVDVMRSVLRALVPADVILKTVAPLLPTPDGPPDHRREIPISSVGADIAPLADEVLAAPSKSTAQCHHPSAKRITPAATVHCDHPKI